MLRHLLPLLFLMPLSLLAACTGAQAADVSGATSALTSYLTALVEKDEQRMVSLVCPAWEADALLEFDAFQAVETSLEGLSCRQVGSQDGALLASCQGKILARYVSETQTFDLGQRVYRLEKQDSSWQVCGYTLE